MSNNLKRIVFDLRGVLFSNGYPYVYNSLKREGIDKSIISKLLFSELNNNLNRGRISSVKYWNNFTKYLSSIPHWYFFFKLSFIFFQ